MERLVVLYGDNCGYCKKAKMLIKRALEKENKFLSLDIRFVHEDSAEGQGFMHKLTPAFYCNRTLLFEGNPSMDIIIDILDRCFENGRL